jgi:multisubunit Na+/H+ antiporter MnhG subunit
MSLRELATWVLLMLGVAIELVACIGVLAMRDAQDRLHFNAPTALGAVAIAAAVFVEDSFSLLGDKALLIAAFVLAASPLLGHATGRALRVAERGDWRPGSDEDVDVDVESP